jgi:hypothetical protein
MRQAIIRERNSVIGLFLSVDHQGERLIQLFRLNNGDLV